MAYPEKKKYPYGFMNLALRFTGRMIQGSQRPANAFFSASGEKVYFNAYFNHEKSDEKFSAGMSIVGFNEFLTVVEEMANTPFVVGEQNQKLVNRQSLLFFKDGKFNHGGTELGLVRNEEGLIYLLVKNKKIPSIPFDFLPQGDYGWADGEGNPPPVFSQSKRKALSWVHCMRELMAAHVASEGKSGGESTPTPTKPAYTPASAPSASDGYDEFENF